jgi:beta-lysine 5,6-aminomutase alpha subunit
MESRLHLPPERIDRARELASRIVAPVQEFIDAHTTVTVERATLRLAGADGADADGVPVPNLVVDQVRDRLEEGALRYWVNALVRTGDDVAALSRRVAGVFRLDGIPLADPVSLEAKAAELVSAASMRVRGNRKRREELLARYAGKNHSPLLYVIVATGNIHEDVKQARAAASQGADVVAVIRTTAQSLLDYVPFGATTEGFGGTYATQENFRIMRAALDEEIERLGRYVHLTNYASGLCMPEIAVMGALERLDMMLNDSMYGILFRDINMYRTFVDQKFSRMVNAWAGVVINTGEDNYLTTSDAVEKAYTVLASQFLNERFARVAGLEPWQMGLGHAFEMDPSLPDGFLLEVAQALLAREIFPEAPLKYMPPTKFMTGDVFRGVVQNALFNFASKLTGQGIHLLGMLTEAIHTPFMQDRYLALENAKYVMGNMAGLGEEITFRKDGVVVKRANQVLEEAVAFLEKVEGTGLMDAIAAGLFADVKRPRDGGKGLDGLRRKGEGYWNPFEVHLTRELGLGGGR